MNKLILSIISILLSFSAYSVENQMYKPKNIEVNELRNVIQASGEQIAQYLNTDYAADGSDCSSSPAFVCSGIMIRAALPGQGYHVWDPSPSAKNLGSISFSYLRSDDNSLEFVHDETSGFIFYPQKYTPSYENSNIEVRCSFPLDADTVNRDNYGCGEHSGNYPTSAACQSQNIMTAQEWYNNDISMDGQCGFDVSEDSGYDTADAFLQTIKARALLTEKKRSEQNEILFAAWDAGEQDTLPIEAFWYIKDDSAALINAQYNQSDFYQSTSGNWFVPIIMITPPTSTSGSYTFTYNKKDQVITSKSPSK